MVWLIACGGDRRSSAPVADATREPATTTAVHDAAPAAVDAATRAAKQVPPPRRGSAGVHAVLDGSVVIARAKQGWTRGARERSTTRRTGI
jgi:hypothetical protein